MTVTDAGEDWPNAAAELDVEMLANDIERGLLVRARTRFEEYTNQLVAQNEDRAEAMLRSLEAHLKQQQRRHEELRNRHLARGNVGLAKAEEKNIERLRARVERQNLAIEEKRGLRHSMEEICVGVVRVVEREG